MIMSTLRAIQTLQTVSHTKKSPAKMTTYDVGTIGEAADETGGTTPTGD